MTNTLEIVNHLLNVIGESPVSDATSDHPSVLSARVVLDSVNKEVQSRGWWFNTEFNLKLSPNELGHLILPTGTLFVDPVAPSSHLVRRGGKLYDPYRHTFRHTDPVYVDAVIELPIEDLPESAAMYIKHKSAQMFYTHDDGDRDKLDRLAAESLRAWAALQSASLKASDINVFNRPAVAELRYRMNNVTSSTNPMYPGGRV